jgi:hypothetical protein
MERKRLDGRIAKNAFACWAVVNAVAFYVHQRDHVLRVLGNDLEQLIPLLCFTANRVNANLLVSRDTGERRKREPIPAWQHAE